MVEDEFFHQLASGALADGPPADAAPRRQPTPAAATARPSQRPPDTPGRRRSGGADSARTVRPGRSRLALVVALAAVAAVALVALALGSGDADRSRWAVADAANRRGEPNGRPATDHARLTVWWPGADRSHPRELSARWRPGGRAVIEGRLTSDDGDPIAGARIDVLAGDAAAPEQGSRTVGELRTDHRGRFATAIAVDRGAARKALTFVYLAGSRDRAPAATAGARLAVTGTISAHATTSTTRRGANIELAGHSPGGATVELLARQPGRRQWHLSSITRASPAGRWEGAVHVPSYGPRGTYLLRARTVGDARRAFVSASSRPINVRVR